MALMTLKEAREAAGLSQAALAQRANIPSPYISYGENGARNWTLVEMIRLERALKTRIAWPDSISTHQKVEFIQTMVSLVERFPLMAVIDAARKSLPDDQLTGDPSLTLRHFAEAVILDDDEVLLPPDARQR